VDDESTVGAWEGWMRYHGCCKGGLKEINPVVMTGCLIGSSINKGAVSYRIGRARNIFQ